MRNLAQSYALQHQLHNELEIICDAIYVRYYLTTFDYHLLIQKHDSLLIFTSDSIQASLLMRRQLEIFLHFEAVLELV